MLSRTKVLGKLACLALSKILGIGAAKCNWKQVKKIKYGDHANIRSSTMSLVSMYVDTLSTLGPHSSPNPSITMCS
jgi:hypothetical protein